jgi:hypothetical protein
MKQHELKARVLAAASAARHAGFLETSKALIRMAELCDSGLAQGQGDQILSDTSAFWIAEKPKGQSIH